MNIEKKFKKQLISEYRQNLQGHHLIKEHNDTVNETEIQDISITFKIIKILGQIIKNQYGDLKARQTGESS